MANPLLLLLAVGGGALILSKKKKKSTANGYGKGYGKGTVGGNYRLAVVQGQSCGDCKYAMALKADYGGTYASPGADAYCEYWKTAVGADYVCDSFQPRASETQQSGSGSTPRSSPGGGGKKKYPLKVSGSDPQMTGQYRGYTILAQYTPGEGGDGQTRVRILGPDAMLKHDHTMKFHSSRPQVTARKGRVEDGIKYGTYWIDREFARG